jgi:hypothetical protein
MLPHYCRIWFDFAGMNGADRIPAHAERSYGQKNLPDIPTQYRANHSNAGKALVQADG